MMLSSFDLWRLKKPSNFSAVSATMNYGPHHRLFIEDILNTYFLGYYKSYLRAILRSHKISIGSNSKHSLRKIEGLFENWMSPQKKQNLRTNFWNVKISKALLDNIKYKIRAISWSQPHP